MILKLVSSPSITLISLSEYFNNNEASSVAIKFSLTAWIWAFNKSFVRPPCGVWASTILSLLILVKGYLVYIESFDFDATKKFLLSLIAFKQSLIILLDTNGLAASWIKTYSLSTYFKALLTDSCLVFPPIT